MIARVRAWLSMPEFLLFHALCRRDREGMHGVQASDSFRFTHPCRRQSFRDTSSFLPKGSYENEQGLLADIWWKSGAII